MNQRPFTASARVGLSAERGKLSCSFERAIEAAMQVSAGTGCFWNSPRWVICGYAEEVVQNVAEIRSKDPELSP
jgi:hypothetical protein